MKKIIYVVGMVIFVIVGCSKEEREEVVDRVGTATKALAGDLSAKPVEPKIVKEVKVKESLKQDREWTPENQIAYPLEYCLAQLDEISKIGRSIEVQSHRMRIARSALEREIQSDDLSLSSCKESLDELKQLYREAEISNTWPIVFRNYSMNQEKTKSLIVDLNRKSVGLEKAMPEKKNKVTNIDVKIGMLEQEARSIVEVRDRLQNTIQDIKTRRIGDSERNINDALNSINDSLKALNVGVVEISTADVIIQSGSKSDDDEFAAIMSK